MAKKFPNCRKRLIGGHEYWIARLVFPADPLTGIKPKPEEFSAKTALDAHNKREKRRAEHKRNPKADRFTTFAEYLVLDFLPFEEARHKSGELTWGRYSERKSRIERFILKHPEGKRLCATTLGKLTPETLEHFFEQLLKSGISPGRRNMVRQDVMLSLRKAKRRLLMPVTEYFLDIQVARTEQKIKKVFDAEEILNRIKDESLPLESRAIVAFEFILNPRPNEMWALQWFDISWHSQQVTINKAVSRGEHGFVLRETTKTGRKGDRILPLGPLLTDLLRRVQKARMKGGHSSDFVFCQKDGRSYEKDAFKYAWRKIRADLKLPEGPTFYSLKTTGNSYALANGVTSAAQSKKMGHQSTRMADNAYRTIVDAEVVKAVEVYSNRQKRSG